MQFKRVPRRQHVDRAADGREIGTGHADGIRIRILKIETRPELAVLELAVDDFKFQLEIASRAGTGVFHLGIGNDRVVFACRDDIESGARLDFGCVKIQCGHDGCLSVMPAQKRAVW